MAGPLLLFAVGSSFGVKRPSDASIWGSVFALQNRQGEDYMNKLEYDQEIYENCLKIKSSDTWSLNDLLQYSLELILSDEEDCIPTDLSNDIILAREKMLAEIENAVSEQKKNNDLPPMPIVASSISCLGVFLKNDELGKLEKLLNRDYRRKRGEKSDADKTRGIDIERLFIHKGYLATCTSSEAVGELAYREGIDDSSARKAIKRGGEYLNETLHVLSGELGYKRADLVNFLRRQIIKNEIKKLLPSSSALTTIELIKDFFATHKRGT